MTDPEHATDVPTLVRAYLHYAESRADEDFWAWDHVSTIVNGPDAERAWDLVVALVRGSSDEHLDYVGAGPVEDLVNRHGEVLIDWIEGEARRDARFREALASIWLTREDIPGAVLDRVQTAAGGRIVVFSQAEIDAANPDPDELPPWPQPRA